MYVSLCALACGWNLKKFGEKSLQGVECSRARSAYLVDNHGEILIYVRRRMASMDDRRGNWSLFDFETIWNCRECKPEKVGCLNLCSTNMVGQILPGRAENH